MEVIENYTVLVVSTLLLAGLMLIQLLVADVAGLKERHVPGTMVPQDHDRFLFRASRALANTNESIVLYVLLAVLMIVYGVNPEHSGMAAIVYLIGRAGHSLCYWFDVRIARSVFFGLALMALIGMFVLCILAYLN